MDNGRRLAINMIAQIMVFIINLVVNFFLTPYITEHVGKEVYGFINLAFQVTGYISIVTTALNGMVGRYITISITKEDYKSANMYFSSVIVANSIITGILLLPSFVLVYYMEEILNVPSQNLGDVKLLWSFIFGAFLLTLIMNCYGVATYVTNRLDLAAKRTLETKIINAVVLVVCFNWLTPRVWYVGFANFLCGLWIIVTNIHYTRKLVPQLRFSKNAAKFHAVKELIKVGIWNSIQHLSSVLVNGCDMIMTNLFINATTMTLMGFAKSIPGYLISLIGIVSNSFAPQMTILYGKEDMKGLVAYTKSAIKVCGFICSVPILGFVCFGKSFFQLWLPTLSEKEVMMVQILSVMILAQTIFDVYIYPLYSVNMITCKLRMPVLVSLGIGVANIIGSIVLYKYTNLGVYAIQLVSSVLLTLRVFIFTPIYAAYILNQKWWEFYGPLLRGLLSSFVILVVYNIILHNIALESWGTLIVYALPCGILGYVINYMIVLDHSERLTVRSIILKSLGRH